MPSYVEFSPSATYEDAIERAAADHRIDTEYWDIFHHRHVIPPEIQRRLLAAAGWDTSSLASINSERERRFREEYTCVAPATAVISELDKSILITLPASRDASLGYELRLEDGHQICGTIETQQLEPVRYVALGAERWIAYRLAFPAELPLGYHKLSISTEGQIAGQTDLIVCPDRAYVPDFLAEGGRSAGFNITLYGLRSQRNWGSGDFTDLHALVDWAREAGFSFIGLNPLHALHNRAPYNTSPYLPLSLYYKNLIYVDIEAVPEFQKCACARALLESARIRDKIAQLRGSEFVVYHEIARIKRRFLKLLYREFRRARSRNFRRAQDFLDYCEREGDLLQNFALYSALDEVLHKQDRNRWTWHHWPVRYHSPDTDACRLFAAEHARLLDFYKYVQFVIEEQLSAAQAYSEERGLSIGLYHDLALATDRCGSDLWAYRDFYVNGCRVGAPPDDFSPNGQDWAFPPPNSEAHRKNGYRLYRESIRKIVRHGGALRIDHVMRLFRLFWIPDGATAAEGTYVRDRATELMRILALESVRSKNIVIGEDLGTVTDEIRDMLSSFRILSYRLFYFERGRDGSFKNSWEYPTQALVSSSTHDLATMCGFWTSRDIEARKNAGLVDEYGYRNQIEDRRREKQRMLDVLHAEGLLPHWYPRNADDVREIDGEFHNAAIAFLARVPSALLLLNQEDLTKETEQQNLPGSTAEYPNWQRKMRVSVEDLRSETWLPYTAMFRDQLARSGRKGS